MPASVSRVAEAWPLLPPHIRESILTLVDASVQINGSQVSRSEGIYCNHKIEPDRFKHLARVLAIRCRHIIQGCLRGEEWQDADEAFFQVIAEELAGL